MTEQEIMKKLAEPFPFEEVGWMAQLRYDSGDGLVVPYLEARTIQARLDETAGALHWQNTFEPWHTATVRKRDRTYEVQSQLCGISILCDEHGWITKYDGAEDSDIEPVKGGLSDAFKRAAVQWGVGRYLYGLHVTAEVGQRKNGSLYIPNDQVPVLRSAYADLLTALADPEGAGKAARGQALHLLPESKPLQYEYIIEKLEVSSQRNTTRLTLRDRENREVRAYLPGVNPELADGCCLRDVTLESRRQGDQCYQVLRKFKIAA